MGNPKQKWTTEEEEALLAGVNKYGSGKWKFIQKDPEFNRYLHSRSNIDLKDKWRNMSVAGQGSRPKPKTTQDIPVTPSVNVQTPATAPATAPASASASATTPPPAPAPAVKLASQADNVKDDVAKELADSKNGHGYNEMIFHALSAEPNGLDIGSVVTYIEQRTEVPQNFRKQLGSKLRRLCLRGKLEKVENLYLMKDSSEANKNIRRDNGPRLPLSTAQMKAGESLEEAGKTAAFKVVEAEHKSTAAAEAVKEAERISKLAEETDSIKQLAEEIFERCSHGELVQI